MKTAASSRPAPRDEDPQWYKDAIIYELRVRSFFDKNADGLGDLAGLTEKLDYLQDLGVTALWLLPFYPSPMRDDGYDTADYTQVHPEVGNLEDFKTFLAEAHRRGLRVITELVLNHTSDQHPWFQRARRAPPGSAERDFYVWSDTAERYKDARIIFKDFEPSNWGWDPVAKAYFWHRFYAHQPDLNFESAEVQTALLAVVDFWFALGVDGLRLDAVPYLYEQEGTNCENLPRTHEFLRKLRRHVDERFQGRMLLAEANQWPEDSVAYFGQGDECHMAFHFPIMPRIFMSIHMEDRFPLMDILAQTPALHPSCQWALFLRNHDELTLEMVTDEERDYMYRAFAHEQTMRINLGIRRRLAPLLGNNRNNMELMNALLFSLPGTPVLYYGDEIGMGDNVYLGDRNGVRTPMQWSADRNAGFSRANAQRMILPIIIDPEYHYEAINVEAQQQNSNSLLWWTKRLIALRKRFKAFGRGSIEFLSPDNPRVLAFIREHEGELVLVVANLSRFVQYVELDLSRHRGLTPLELFGRTRFPPISDRPYLLSLGGHAFYWFSLERPRNAAEEARTLGPPPPALEVLGGWTAVFEPDAWQAVASWLPSFLATRPWFLGGERTVEGVELEDLYEVDESCRLAMVRVIFGEGAPSRYLLPLAFAAGARAREILVRSPEAVIASVRLHGADDERVSLAPDAPPGALPRAPRAEEEGVLFDAGMDAAGGPSLLGLFDATRTIKGRLGELSAWAAEPAAREVRASSPSLAEVAGTGEHEVRALRAAHENAGLIYGERHVLKLFRHVDEGTSPEVEIARHLGRSGFAGTPALSGTAQWHGGRGEPVTVGILSTFIPNEGQAWTYTREELGRYFERVLAHSLEQPSEPPVGGSPLELAAAPPPRAIQDLIGTYLASATLLGQRVAELHRALAEDQGNPAFAPEPYSSMDQRSAYQSMRNTTGKVLRALKGKMATLPAAAAQSAQQLVAREADIYKRFEGMLERRITALRTRCHGDLHLGQVLYTGKDFVVIDFEQQRDVPLSERRRKRSPLRDVAGMLRSFHYAAITTLLDPAVVREADRRAAWPWGQLWQSWAAASFLRGYLETARGAPFLPADPAELRMILDAFVLARALEELQSELERGSNGVVVPLYGVAQLLGSETPAI